MSALIMGVLNVTPDSFSDGGFWRKPDDALRHAVAMVKAGADIIDVGGESTRPGSVAISADEELSRVIPFLERLSGELETLISIDTSKPEVMRAAVDAGAGMINDVFALQSEGALEVAAHCEVPVCLMHMRGRPSDMQKAPRYESVVDEVTSFLERRAQDSLDAGIDARHIVLDPGFGFGKTLEQNLELFRAIPRLREIGYPLLIGVSRKTMLGTLTDKPVDQRMVASVVAAAMAAAQGASILRVHDVSETVDALKVFVALSDVEIPADEANEAFAAKFCRKG